jgi:hypothetical protein
MLEMLSVHCNTEDLSAEQTTSPLSLYQPALLSWFLVLFWFILRLSGCLTMVVGLFKPLLGQKLEHAWTRQEAGALDHFNYFCQI